MKYAMCGPVEPGVGNREDIFYRGDGVWALRPESTKTGLEKQ